MGLLGFYRKETTVSGGPIIAVTIVSGIAQGLLLGIITKAAVSVNQDGLNLKYFFLFGISFALVMIGKRYALVRATKIMEDIVERVRIRISTKIRDSELIFLENIGKGEIYTRITQGTNQISESAVIVINAFQSTVMVSFCILFVAVLSKHAFVITLLAIAMGVLNYHFHLKKINDELRETTLMESKFFDMLNDVLEGFKELKMNRSRRTDYFKHFKNISEKTKDLKISTGIHFTTEMMFSHFFFYLLIGVIIFILPKITPETSGQVIQVVAAIMFIMGPLNMVVGAISVFARANIAVENLYGLEKRLDEAKALKPERKLTSRKIKKFDRIAFENINFSYLDKTGTPLFTVGPIDLSVERGETLFIVGGNGSGKSTFMKLLTGLYHPSSGKIRVDRRVIDKTSYPMYREMFSTVFSDFHLFDKLYGFETPDYDRIDELLELFELENKVEVVEEKFTTIDLSTGQRKRLAMIVSLLEDRPIYVFDEWAADQDPIFREYYYEVLLKNMKEQGKTIIAVSHDDRYFHVADRVMKMEWGRFIDMKTGAPI